MSQHKAASVIDVDVLAAHEKYTIMMQNAAGAAIPAVGTTAANEDLLLGVLTRENFEAGVTALRLFNDTGTFLMRLANTAVTVANMNVPLTITADGQVEPGGAGIKIGLPRRPAAVGEWIEVTIINRRV